MPDGPSTSYDGRSHTDELSDDDLVSLYAGGDPDAFDVIFDRYHVPVFNFARHMTGREADAEEILQDTFLAVARSAGAYVPRGRFKSWIMSIVRNRCLNRIQAERARRAALAAGGPRILEAAWPKRGSEARPAEDETLTTVRAALAKLPERQREVLLLHVFEKMPYREIASALEMPIGTVKTLLHRARASVARLLNERARTRRANTDEEEHRAL